MSSSPSTAPARRRAPVAHYVLVATIVGAVALMPGGFDLPALPVLLALVGLSVVDAGLRYVVIRHRSLR